ncbi:hypothetical protein Tco_0930923 [Tanacetum coccineum]
MNLGKRMVKNFFECVGATYGTNIWASALIVKEMKVHTTLRNSNDGIIFGAAAIVHLPHSPDSIFKMLRDEKNAISPGDHQTAISYTTIAGSSSTSSGGGGSNVTVAVQMMLTLQPSEEIVIHDIIGIAAKAIKETVLKLDGTLY